MPLPFIIGAVAVAAGVGGVATGVKGGIKMKEANDTLKRANEKDEENSKKLEELSKKVGDCMDKLGKFELKILSSFKSFSDVIEKIHNKPEFAAIQINDVKLPEYRLSDINKVSTGASVILGGLGGAAAGTAGGIAASGATTTAVMALGTASTGTAISTLSGAAATNATLAALGGGAIGSTSLAGGMALGTTVLAGATLGVGLLIGGVIFNATGSSLSNKADKAWDIMKNNEKIINEITEYLNVLYENAEKFKASLVSVNRIYRKNLKDLRDIVELKGKRDWNEFTREEKLITENTVLLVQLLYSMCKVQLVLKSSEKENINKVNKKEIKQSIKNAKQVIYSINNKN